MTDEDGAVPVADLPFQFLGFSEDGYFFLPKRQNVPIKISRGQTSMKNNMTELAPMDWWMAYFSRLNKDGEEVLDLARALQWLRDGSTRKGMYNDELLLGTGAYKDDAGYIVNTGIALASPCGAVSTYEEYTGRLAFTRAKVELKIDAEPWTEADGRFLYDQLKTFGFDQPLAYYSIIGFCALAPFAPILFRRPHIWITAKRGTGKSALLEWLIVPLLGEEYAFYTDGTTEAGIRQTLRRNNRPVVLDEFEANKKYDIAMLENILKLARSSYTGSQTVKGSSSQNAIAFSLKMMFCFASINVNISNDADRSRIAVCRMKESNGKMKTIPNPDGLRARMFYRIGEVNENILKLHATMEDMDYEYRTADTYAPLMVGLWMTLSDRPFPVNRGACDPSDVELYDHILAALPQTAQTEEKHADEERIVERILQEKIRISSDTELTVAEMLSGIDLSDPSKLIHGDTLQRYGIRRHRDKALGFEVLTISHDHDKIKEMLKETPFGSSYKEVLKRNGAYVLTKPVRMAGAVQTCLVLRWKDIEDKYLHEADVIPF